MLTLPGMPPLSLRNDRQVILCFSIAALTVAVPSLTFPSGPMSLKFSMVSRSPFTPTMTNGLPAYRSASARSCGTIAMHGAHQVAQKTTSVTLPRDSNSLSDLPSTVGPGNLRNLLADAQPLNLKEHSSGRVSQRVRAVAAQSLGRCVTPRASSNGSASPALPAAYKFSPR